MRLFKYFCNNILTLTSPAGWAYVLTVKELSIHVDESGNTNMRDSHGQNYCLTFVFHDQSYSLENDFEMLEKLLTEASLPVGVIHSIPLIRNKPPFDTLSPSERISIFRRFFTFACHIPITYKSFIFEKQMFRSAQELQKIMKNAISEFIDENFDFFASYDIIKIYYDFGQAIVVKALDAFPLKLSSVKIRYSRQENYRLMQVADMICTLEQINHEWKLKQVSRSAERFFDKRSAFQRNYYAKLKRKSFEPLVRNGS